MIISPTLKQLELKNVTLTPKEAEIIELLGEGFTNKFIAQLLVVETETIQRHLEKIYLKIGLYNHEGQYSPRTKLALFYSGKRILTK